MITVIRMVVLLCSSKERLISSMANTIPASGVLNAAATPAAAPARISPFSRSCLGNRGKAAQFVHDGCADLHGGAFAAHGCSAHQPQDGEDDFPDGHAQRKHLLADLAAFLRVQRCDDLGNAAALCSGKILSGDVDDQREPERGDQQRQIKTK